MDLTDTESGLAVSPWQSRHRPRSLSLKLLPTPPEGIGVGRPALTP